MRVFSNPTRSILAHPGAFSRRTLAGFARNQGLLLAAAIAYYALLSVVPLLILSIDALSKLVEQNESLTTLGRHLERLVPSQSTVFLNEIANFLENRAAIGAALLATMLFFSSLGFSVLEKAMSVIFAHRQSLLKRHFLTSALLPYCFVLFLCLCLLALTVASFALDALSHRSVSFLGIDWSLREVSSELLYLFGFATEVVSVTTIYRVMPVGKIRMRHALAGGVAVAGLWEVIRQVLTWYLSTLSKASIVHGPMATTVVALLSLEIVATIMLFGAQVISEYEQLADN
ncbi:MAG TPA: YihY/virulence factor BrkB family protein [Accumulibacter sp.]|nr:YihY/virulence factor BrkB family protein [Accumulibacter sp.]HQC79369.1 YihY/virulence factor BrkB family protein [Accumulibacter sp.]